MGQIMGKKILLVDDSATQRDVLKIQLSKVGYEVFTANDGSEAYQKVFEIAPDLIMSDVMMPNLNGYQLCRLLKNDSLTGSIPIILLTVLDKKIDQFWSDKSGADKFISKTASFEEIIEAVKFTLEWNVIDENCKNELLKQNVYENTAHNQINKILDKLLMDTMLLNEFRNLNEYISQEKVLTDKMFELLNSFIDYNIAGLFFKSPDDNEMNTLHLAINKKKISEEVIENVKRIFFQSMSIGFNINETCHHINTEKYNTLDEIASINQFKSMLILPIIYDNKLLGGLCFYNEEETKYEDVSFYETMYSELMLIFKTKRLHAKNQLMSITDGLTGLYNRRHFDFNIEREFARAKRYPCKLSLAIVDIDYFKVINDKYGHQFGDYALKEISKILKDNLRKTDMIYRYGGEEIAIILTETDIEGASIPLERIRNYIAEYNFQYNDENANITISIGLSMTNSEMSSPKEFIEIADKNLYIAKQNGRNRLESIFDGQAEVNN